MKKQITKQGFSLVEVIISVFIFSLAMVLLTGSFASFFKNYANQKKLQKNFENAQYVTNLMAKTIRTSHVFLPTFVTPGIPFSLSSRTLNIYDYSQGKCISYKLLNDALQGVERDPATAGDPNSCSFPSGGFSNLTSGIINNVYVVVYPTNATTNPIELGKVTMSVFVESEGQNFAEMPIQVSVSLRQ